MDGQIKCCFVLFGSVQALSNQTIGFACVCVAIDFAGKSNKIQSYVWWIQFLLHKWNPKWQLFYFNRACLIQHERR